MKVVFRVDASLEIGSGHVMRCLTLALELEAQGGSTRFICRDHPGHLEQLILSEGFRVNLLENEANADPDNLSDSRNPYGAWLGTSQVVDARQTFELLKNDPPNWLVVDHYALDECWERIINKLGCRVFVIDDLANRKHYCDMLLDQTLGRKTIEYSTLVPETTEVLTGSPYMLLRSEFQSFRDKRLSRCESNKTERCFINLGGVDQDNMTGRVLAIIDRLDLPEALEFIVVLGEKNPWKQNIAELKRRSSKSIKVLVGVKNMAELMAGCDLAIGASGTTSWERCCLGLPTLLIVMAENQKFVANSLKEQGAALVLDSVNKLEPWLSQYLPELVQNPEKLQKMSHAAFNVTDGSGVFEVAKQMRYLK